MRRNYSLTLQGSTTTQMLRGVFCASAMLRHYSMASSPRRATSTPKEKNPAPIHIYGPIHAEITPMLTTLNVQMYLKPTMHQQEGIYLCWSLWSWVTHRRAHVWPNGGTWRAAHCTSYLCQRLQAEWWSIGEFHNTVKSRSSLALSTEQLICRGAPVCALDQGKSKLQVHYFPLKCTNKNNWPFNVQIFTPLSYFNFTAGSKNKRAQDNNKNIKIIIHKN